MTTVERERAAEQVQAVPAVVTAADVLNRAADLLEEWGWRQVARGSRAHGSFCAVGALDEAYKDFGDDRWEVPSVYVFPEDVNAALSAVGVRGGGEGLAQFNDAPGRTKAEVVAKLREAAKAAA